MDILNALFKCDVPMTGMDIVRGIEGISQSTVMSVLRELIADRLVEVVGNVNSGNVPSRTFRPTERAKEAMLENLVEVYKKSSAAVSREELCRRLMDIE